MEETNFSNPQPAHEERSGDSDHSKVLVVEDEALIAIYVETIVEQSGYDVAGVVSSLDDALAFIDDHTIDSAVLDVDLNGRPVYPLAEALKRRGIPFIFASSCNERSIPAAYRSGPVVQKPFAPSELRRALAQTNRPRRSTTAR
jgi:DNA-binding response OmpR family regulator